MGRLLGLLRVLTIAFAATMAGAFLMGGRAMAGSVAIADGSHVLSRSDAAAVTDAGSRLGKDAVHIYTTTVLAGDDAAFDDHYAQKLATLSPATIIVGVNTRSRHVTIHGGTGSHLHRRQSAAAVAAFTGGLQANDRYGDALVAMMRSLQKSLTGHEAATGGGNQAAAGNGNQATAGNGKAAAGGGAQADAGHAKKGFDTRTIAIVAIGSLLIVTLAAGITRAIFGGHRRDEWARDEWV